MPKKPDMTSELIAAVEALKKKPNTKDRRTLFLNDQNYERFQRYCEKERLSASEVVDAMIAKLLNIVD